ncbi:hypothetical protein LCGC14_2832980 [marine sediment metagenome]|uniref:Uncharacterized protein n=1 Tax=marine sediment metagenome TaxID=412755 RepID=A0A0F8YDM6_9ZZZZ
MNYRNIIKLKIYSDKHGDSITTHYHIGLHYQHERFDIRFMSVEQYTKPEADARVIGMAADIDAETDGIIIANS